MNTGRLHEPGLAIDSGCLVECESAQKDEKSHILCLKHYKTEMDYKNTDFNSDVVVMYSKLRERTAKYSAPVHLPKYYSYSGLTIAEPVWHKSLPTRVCVNTIKIYPRA